MKKILVMTILGVAALGVYAGPHHGPGPHRPPPPAHHHGHSCWGSGGRNFWPGFVGGVIGGAVATTVVRSEPVVVTHPVVTTPVVVTQPVVTQPVVVSQPVVVAQPATQTQNVWVEGRYIDQVQANGTVVRVWNPGHYELRTVTVQ